MKVSKAKAAEHRERLIEVAGRLFRDKGFDAVGVAEITQAAGLTHGAFYTHFPSKEALCAEATTCAIARSGTLLATAADVAAYVDGYLSPRHVADRAGGCPFAALSLDAARAGDDVHGAISAGLARAVESYAAKIAPGKAKAKDRARALAMFTSLVGGVVLARAAKDASLRSEILDAARLQARRALKA